MKENSAQTATFVTVALPEDLDETPKPARVREVRYVPLTGRDRDSPTTPGKDTP